MTYNSKTIVSYAFAPDSIQNGVTDPLLKTIDVLYEDGTTGQIVLKTLSNISTGLASSVASMTDRATEINTLMTGVKAGLSITE